MIRSAHFSPNALCIRNNRIMRWYQRSYAARSSLQVYSSRRERAARSLYRHLMAFSSSPSIRLPGQKRTNASASISTCRPRSYLSRRAMITSNAVIEKGAGMKLVKGASEELISTLGCRTWPTWGCNPSTFPWSYSDDEVCLVLSGDFTVIPDDGSESMGKYA